METGQKLVDDEITTKSKITASSFTTSALDGRTDVIAPNNATGTYAPGVINVVYRYGGEDPNGILIGDVNLSGNITVEDVTTLQQYLCEQITLEGDALIAAECNSDSRISIKDVTLIQKYLAEYTTEIGRVGRRVSPS